MQKAKLDKMKEEGKDEHDVKKMGEVNRVFLFQCQHYWPGVARDVDDDTRLSPKNCRSQGGTRAAARNWGVTCKFLRVLLNASLFHRQTWGQKRMERNVKNFLQLKHRLCRNWTKMFFLSCLKWKSIRWKRQKSSWKWNELSTSSSICLPLNYDLCKSMLTLFSEMKIHDFFLVEPENVRLCKWSWVNDTDCLFCPFQVFVITRNKLISILPWQC